MDKNNIIGFGLIFILLFVWMQMNQPSKAELDQRKRTLDSLALVEKREATSTKPNAIVPAPNTPAVALTTPDSNTTAKLNTEFGVLGNAAAGVETVKTLENEFFKVVFTNKGGRIKEVELKNHFKMSEDSAGVDHKGVLKLLEDPKDRFEYLLPVNGASRPMVSTQDLFFEPTVTGNKISFKVATPAGSYLVQEYTIQPNSYEIKYDLKYEGLGNILKSGTNSLDLNWINYLDKLEKNHSYERNYSTVYYKSSDDSPSYCSCTGDDEIELKEQKVKWVSNVNQFFNSTLIAETAFNKAKLETQMEEETSSNLKRISSLITLPIDASGSGTMAMKMYIGPNEFDRLKAYNLELEDIIPYGMSIFGTVNRWIVRPIFNLLSSLTLSKGLVILLLTLIVKLLLYPLSYRMLYSQAKMAALKPQIDILKAKFKDDTQQVQVETMKMYKEFGVNPLGGCLPMIAQLPIWFALYRFFPASIEFRQAGFLWINDLTSYEVFAKLPFNIPFYGSHVALFAILWTISTLVYTYYTTKDMDMSANPGMKYMQYFMPVIFLSFFNTTAAGLTYYMFASNLLNIAQTIITRKWLISGDKIQREFDDHKKKPKKKGGFTEKLEQAMKEQQRLQQEKAKKK